MSAEETAALDKDNEKAKGAKRGKFKNSEFGNPMTSLRKVLKSHDKHEHDGLRVYGHGCKSGIYLFVAALLFATAVVVPMLVIEPGPILGWPLFRVATVSSASHPSRH